MQVNYSELNQFKMKHSFFWVIIFTLTVINLSCSDDETSPISIVETSDFSVSMDENPVNGQVIGNIVASTNQGSISFSITSQSPNRAIQIDSSTGQLSVLDSSFFDYEVNQTITGTARITNGEVIGISNINIVLNNLFDTVQERLDNGESPIEIYKSNNELLKELYGKSYQGGLIFYLNINTGDGLAASQEDLSDNISWSLTGSWTGAQNSEIGSGESNTNLIVQDQGEGNVYAAKLCQDYSIDIYSDWFLPSKDELNTIYTNLKTNNLGDLANDRYWSSTETDVSPNFAWFQDFYGNGTQNGNQKSDTYRVRAIRAF